MLVVSDSTPLNILIRINQVEVLPKLFDSVAIPRAVAEEMSKPTTPDAVRSWAASPPPWLSVLQPQKAVDPSERRHRGERDAISLAIEVKADAILLDEPKPRREAEARGLLVIGTVRVLERAADQGLIRDLASVHAEIRASDFRIDEEILRTSLDGHHARAHELSRTKDGDHGGRERERGR